MKGWPNTNAFYADREERRLSGESDFGVWWRDDTAYPTYRVSVISATGEVYACNGDTDEIELLGVVDHVPGQTRDGSTDRIVAYEAAETILDGWAQRCGEERSLEWVRKRLVAAGVGA